MTNTEPTDRQIVEGLARACRKYGRWSTDFGRNGEWLLDEAYEWNPETRQYVTGENNRPIRKIVPIDTNALVGGEVRIEIGPK